ncbi:MAG: radical SAM protein [Candidatus Sumerlaeia bacterium]
MSRRSARSQNPVPPRLWRKRYLAAELGGWRKPFGSAPVAMGLVFPNTYAAGMSSLGFQVIFGVLNRRADALCHRFFMDAPGDGSLEADQPARLYPLLGFSLSYELDYINVVRFLERSGISLRHEMRRVGEPVLIGGGPAVSLNPYPLLPIFDVLVFGDGEVVMDRLADGWMESGGDRQKFLETASRIRGVVAPPLMAESTNARPLAVASAETPFDAGYPFSFDVITPHAEFSEICVVELSRGCPYRCTFCTEGYRAAAYRPRPLEQIQSAIEEKTALTNRFGFLASAVGSHPRIRELCVWALERGLQVSYSSLRVEDVKDEMLDLLVAGGQRTLTIAPETGTYELRRKLLKRMPDERIFAFTEQAVARGMQHLKLYFMIGLPGETDDDVRAIAALTRRLREIQTAGARRRGQIGRLVLNIGIYVPKPSTPLARGGFTHPRLLRERRRLLQHELAAVPNVQARWQPLQEAVIEAVLANARQDGLDFMVRLAKGRPGVTFLMDWLERTVPVNEHFELRYEDLLEAVKAYPRSPAGL